MKMKDRGGLGKEREETSLVDRFDYKWNGMNTAMIVTYGTSKYRNTIPYLSFFV